jgi:hypothetical protein
MLMIVVIGRAVVIVEKVAGGTFLDVDFEGYRPECNLWAHMDIPEAKDQALDASGHGAEVIPGWIVTVRSAAGWVAAAAVEKSAERLRYWATFVS